MRDIRKLKVGDKVKILDSKYFNGIGRIGKPYNIGDVDKIIRIFKINNKRVIFLSKGQVGFFENELKKAGIEIL